MEWIWSKITALSLAEWVQVASALGTVSAAVFAALAARAAFRSASVAQKQLPEVQRQVEAANLQTLAAQEQTQIQRRVHIDMAQPYVWADIRPDPTVGTLLNLVVGNSGPTIATNISISIDPPLQPIKQMEDRITRAASRLANGFPSLAPGRTLSWPMGQGFNLISEEEEHQRHKFTINADGPFGSLEPNSYVIDLGDLRGVMDRPAGSLYELTKAVDDLGEAIVNSTGPAPQAGTQTNDNS